MSRARRIQRERPFLDEHHASRSRFLPLSFDGLRRWFIGQWHDELPGDIHGAGVEWEKPGRIVRADGSGVTDPGGGNSLGAPAYRPGFRRFLTGSSAQVEHPTYDGATQPTTSYATPLRWAVDFVGRGSPAIAAALRWLARNDGDWHGLSIDCGTCGSRVVLPSEYAEAVARRGLELVARSFRAEPAPRSVPWTEKSSSQQQAEEVATA